MMTVAATFRAEKQPDDPSGALVADNTRVAVLYIDPIAKAWARQSSGSSWMIHNESIHKYLTPMALVVTTAS